MFLVIIMIAYIYLCNEQLFKTDFSPQKQEVFE